MQRARISTWKAGPGVGAADAASVAIARGERERLRAILEIDRNDEWRNAGARDLAEFVATRYGIGRWKARRLVGTAYALEHLPLTEHALVSGQLPMEKVVELTRFATPATEKGLISWARRVTPAGIRERADRELRAPIGQVKEEERVHCFSWSPFIDRQGYHLQGRLPNADANVVIAAIERLVGEMPAPVPEEGAAPLSADEIREQKQADALVALCSARIADDQDPDRATVVVHAPYEAMTGDSRAGAIGANVPVHARTTQRLACDGRLEVVLHGEEGVVGVGRATREAPHWLRRQVLARDLHTCTFPGCEMKRFLRTHHIRWWEFDGPTNLDNLVTVCHAHHKLVHEDGWDVALTDAGEAQWSWPSGRRYEPGPAPPPDAPPEPEPSRSPSMLSNVWHFLLDDTHEVIKNPGTRAFLHYGARLMDRNSLRERGLRPASRSDGLGDETENVVHHLFGGGAAHEPDPDRPALSRS